MDEIQVFSQAWFKINQRKLLWLLNNKIPFIKDYFRYTLGISRDFEKAIITRISRDNFHVFNGQNERIGIFFSGKPFAKTLYYAYLPLWKACHAFDMKFANKFFPELNLGFDTLTAYPQSGMGGSNITCMGTIDCSGSSYTNIRSGNGDLSVLSDISLGHLLYLSNAHNNNNVYYIDRGFASFDTSSILSSYSISNAVFNFVVPSGYKGEVQSGQCNINIYKGTQGANTLITTNFNSYNTFLKSLNYSNITEGATNSVTGITTAVVPSGISKLALLTSGDVNSNTPTAGNTVGISSNSINLTISYTLNSKQQQQFIV